MSRGRIAAGLFAASLLLYLCSRAPGLVPYRDTGEMVVAAHSLGVAHPPSYPLYVLFGRLFDAIPLGDAAGRLGLLSVVSAAGAVAILGFVCAGAWGPAAALFAAATFATNPTFWSVAQVQEMYALTALFAMTLFGLGLRLSRKGGIRAWYAACLAFGLFLGNRTDLLLWAPGLVVLGLPRGWKRTLPLAAAFGLLGLAVYLYLPLRSLQGPWLDWNHPATAANFWGSLTRKGYGATLDLLSKNYAAGELFLPNLKVYAVHLWDAFGALGLAAAAAGIAAAWRSDRRRAAGTLLLWAFSGPLFLFLANMPPNPHALAIVEPHYLLSDAALAFFVAEGAAAVLGVAATRWALFSRVVPASLLLAGAALVQPGLSGRFSDMERRWDLLLYDFQGNALRSTPEGAALVAKKDVQLFSLWEATLVSGRRPDVALVSQGIAHSAWYRASQSRHGSRLLLGRLKSKDDFVRFIEGNPMPAYATPDSEIPAGLEPLPGRGLLVRLSPAPSASPDPEPFLVKRGDYRYERRPDFFTADLVSSFAASRQRRGAQATARGAYRESLPDLIGAWSMKRNSPQTAAYLGFAYFQSGEMEKARDAYVLADRLFSETLTLAEQYHSLPELKANVRRSAADASLNLGVCYEKLGNRGEAERHYRRAIALNPRYARAHFNIAVLYWGSDLRRSVAELEAALRADPHYAPARKYLSVAKRKLGGL
jgi:tetratricopeptide (TPR) repeat protein